MPNVDTDTVRVVSLGAYDRFNYGDVLFPLVLDHAVKELSLPPIEHVATRRSDLSAYGGRPTLSPRELRGGPTPSAVILGGGEILGATWAEAVASLTPVPFDLGWLALGRVLPRGAFDNLSRRLLGGSSATPYVPSSSASAAVAVVGNAIGASSLGRLRPELAAPVITALRGARYLSVRDHRGREALNEVDVPAELSPDSVAILRELRPAGPPRSEGPLVVQASRSWYKRHGAGFSAALAAVAPQFPEIVFLPIGLAGGHGDLVGLSQLQRDTRSAGATRTRIASVDSVWSIADQIAEAGVFVGSSLHGAITSMAYGTPHLALAGIEKLDAYVSTWGKDLTIPSVQAAGLPEAIASALKISRQRRIDAADHLAALAQENLHRVLDAAYAG